MSLNSLAIKRADTLVFYMEENKHILQLAKDLVAQHGTDAASIAMENMKDFMQRDDAKSATLWLSVAHEIKRLCSLQVN